MNNQLINNDHFKPEYVGRGIWHSWHSIGFSAETRHDVAVLYETILLYNRVIRCKNCSEHSNNYIATTVKDIYAVLTDKNLTDSEVIDQFNIWLYNYHKKANENAGKKSPPYEDVAKFYLNFEYCTKECAK